MRHLVTLTVAHNSECLIAAKSGLISAWLTDDRSALIIG